MKVTASTPRRLMIDHAPWALGIGTIVAMLVMLFFAWRLFLNDRFFDALVVGACTILFPGGLFHVLTREQLVFDRDEGLVVLRERSLFRGQRERWFRLADFRGVELGTEKSRNGNRMWCILLHFDETGKETRVAFPLERGRKDQAVALHRAIDDWIANADPP